MKQVARRLVAKRPILARLYVAFRFDEAGKPVGPGVQFRKHLFVTWQIFGLIVTVRFVFSKFHVLPQRIGNFDAAIPALLHQRRVTVALAFERFLLGIEIMLVSILEEPGPTCRIKFVSARSRHSAAL